jgi:hypothetical protein
MEDFSEASIGQQDHTNRIQKELGISPEVIAHSRALLKEARQNMSRYAPHALPTEPTVIVAEQGDMYGGGEYLGEFDGDHYLDVTFGKRSDLMDPTKKETLLTLITHELVHQKQFETPSIATTPQLAESTLSPDEMSELTPQQIVDLLRKQKESMQLSNLHSALLEGTAVQIELHILKEKIASAQATGDQKQVALLTDVLQERLLLLEQDKELAEFENGYFDGSKMVSGLIDTFGFEKIFTVLETIDYQQCRNIKANTPEYDAIVQNPRLLPGLEQFDSPHQ